jgi:protein-L-isoaspartate(D-aspartate) O-methyltransferase
MQASIAMRRGMVRSQIVSRGVVDPRVIAAMELVPREEFVPEQHRALAYEDVPLPIEDGQTISQPYVVALMAEAAAVRPTDRVLEVGAGSGYASAVLACLGAEVIAVERHPALAEIARIRLERLGFRKVTVLQGDGSVGVPTRSPFDAIVVSAGGPDVPPHLVEQLAPGGRLVIPVGHRPQDQELVRITREADGTLRRESLGAVRFVPLVGAAGWSAGPARPLPRRRAARGSTVRAEVAAAAIDVACEPFTSVDAVDLSPLMARIGSARVVLIGESTHGTSEFYRLRARITRALVERKGFSVVALEADWPDAAVMDRHARGLAAPEERARAFPRFPSWMWRNRETAEFVDWLRSRHGTPGHPAVRIRGLDIYAMHRSIEAVLGFLDANDPAAAARARRRYGCLAPWADDPARYGRAVTAGSLDGCEREAVEALEELLRARLDGARAPHDDLFDAQRNAALVRSAERYYRAMYVGSRESWNLRDAHMFETLQSVMEHAGPATRAVVWAHNSHVGDAAATDMGARGETSLGALARTAFGDGAYLVGMGTDRGTVAAAHEWDGPMQVRELRRSDPGSYERACALARPGPFLLPMRGLGRDAIREALAEPMLERAVGVVYRPDTELASHYFSASLPAQFDEWAWFPETRAVDAAPSDATEDLDPGTYPFGL